MLFNSLGFLVFIIAVFGLYWSLDKKPLIFQNTLLVLSSYLFYSFWNWKFVFLLLFSTLLDYYSGLKISHSKSNKERKIWLILSIAINLGILGFFKYYNFFIDSFVDFLGLFGIRQSYYTLQVILPVGISFYTFHGLSYVLDIYNRKIKPTSNLINYSLFVSFFPLLVAGPIERASHLLPQVEKRRVFNYNKAVDGLRQILWGLFKKLVIADCCATFTDQLFTDYTHESGSALLMAGTLFSFQIYADFSGYSDIALGISRLLGFELLKNFNFPYFSRNIAEFWRKWHISLSSWFKDYVYKPLGGSSGGSVKTIANVFIIFILSGFWHGANWTFIVWGILNALYMVPLILLKRNRKYLIQIAQESTFPSLRESLSIVLTFILVVFGWIIFRSENIRMAIQIFVQIFSFSLLSFPDDVPQLLILIIIVFLIIEWVGRRSNYAIETMFAWSPRLFRWVFYGLILFIIGMFMETHGTPFIYFQF